MDEGAVEPLDVVVLGEGEQHLVADDGEGQEENGAQRHSQGEGTEPQPAGGTGITSGSGLLWVPRPGSAPQRHPAPTGHRVLAEEKAESQSRAQAGTYAILLTAASSSS